MIDWRLIASQGFSTDLLLLPFLLLFFSRLNISLCLLAASMIARMSFSLPKVLHSDRVGVVDDSSPAGIHSPLFFRVTVIKDIGWVQTTSIIIIRAKSKSKCAAMPGSSNFFNCKTDLCVLKFLLLCCSCNLFWHQQHRSRTGKQHKR